MSEKRADYLLRCLRCSKPKYVAGMPGTVADTCLCGGQYPINTVEEWQTQPARYEPTLGSLAIQLTRIENELAEIKRLLTKEA